VKKGILREGFVKGDRGLGSDPVEADLGTVKERKGSLGRKGTKT